MIGLVCPRCELEFDVPCEITPSKSDGDRDFCSSQCRREFLGKVTAGDYHG